MVSFEERRVHLTSFQGPPYSWGTHGQCSRSQRSERGALLHVLYVHAAHCQVCQRVHHNLLTALRSLASACRGENLK